jgi:hypothetical protein
VKKSKGIERKWGGEKRCLTTVMFIGNRFYYTFWKGRKGLEKGNSVKEVCRKSVEGKRGVSKWNRGGKWGGDGGQYFLQ